MKKLLIILLFFISKLYAFLSNPEIVLNDPTKFISKKFTNCEELEKSIDDLYIYDNIYFFDEEYPPYSYYYYRPLRRFNSLKYTRATHSGTGYLGNMSGYLYTYNKDKYKRSFEIYLNGLYENPLYYSKCLEDKLLFVNFKSNNLYLSLKKIVFFQSQNDYIIPQKLRPDSTKYINNNCNNLGEYIKLNSVNSSIYFVYLNTLYKAYLHKNGPLFMFVTENDGKNNYWSHNEGILNSLDGDFIYDVLIVI